ncbi:helix-turn-helix domain-containing protein [Pseudomonas aeruginosa]
MNQAATVSPLAVGPEEAGRISGHTRSAIYEAIARGDLLSFKSGKRRLILIKELEAWLNRLAKENAR